jgi:hypothetical protein
MNQPETNTVKKAEKELHTEAQNTQNPKKELSAKQQEQTEKMRLAAIEWQQLDIEVKDGYCARAKDLGVPDGKKRALTGYNLFLSEYKAAPPPATAEKKAELLNLIRRPTNPAAAPTTAAAPATAAPSASKKQRIVPASVKYDTPTTVDGIIKTLKGCNAGQMGAVVKAFADVIAGEAKAEADAGQEPTDNKTPYKFESTLAMLMRALNTKVAPTELERELAQQTAEDDDYTNLEEVEAQDRIMARIAHTIKTNLDMPLYEVKHGSVNAMLMDYGEMTDGEKCEIKRLFDELLCQEERERLDNLEQQACKLGAQLREAELLLQQCESNATYIEELEAQLEAAKDANDFLNCHALHGRIANHKKKNLDDQTVDCHRTIAELTTAMEELGFEPIFEETDTFTEKVLDKKTGKAIERVVTKTHISRVYEQQDEHDEHDRTLDALEAEFNVSNDPEAIAALMQQEEEDLTQTPIIRAPTTNNATPTDNKGKKRGPNPSSYYFEANADEFQGMTAQQKMEKWKALPKADQRKFKDVAKRKREDETAEKPHKATKSA